MSHFIASKIKAVKQNDNLLRGFLYSLFYFFGRGVGFILMVILARYILPADYGKLSMYNTIFVIMGFMWAFSSKGYTTVVFFREGEQEYKKVLTSVNVLSFFSLLFFSLLAFIFNDTISTALGIPSYIVYFPAVVTFITTFSGMQMDYYRMTENLKKFGLLSCGGAILEFVSAMLFVVTFGLGWLGRVYNAFVSCAVFGTIAIIFMIKNRFFDFDFSKERYKALLLFGLPLIPQASTGWLTQGCDQYIINHFYTSYEVGVFCMAINLMSVIEMIGFSFNNSNSVTLFKILSDKNMSSDKKNAALNKETRQIFFAFLLLISIFILFVCFLLPYLMPAYIDCVPYFLILSIYGFLRCIYLLYCNYLYYFKNTKYLMWSIVLPSVFHLLLSLWLTRYSLYLTAWVFVVTQFIIVIMVYRKAKALKVVYLK